MRAAHITVLFLLLNTAVAFGQGKMDTSVVVLLDVGSSSESGIYPDEAILLNGDANDIGKISGLGLSGSVSGQSTVVLDHTGQRIFVVEAERRRVAAFDLQGNPIWHRDTGTETESPVAIVLNASGEKLVCNISGPGLHNSTLILNASDGAQLDELQISGVALAVSGPTIWAVSKSITAFDIEGNISLLRPLPRPDSVPAHPTVINDKTWSATGVGVLAGNAPNPAWTWIVDREHPDVNGSQNRLFALEPDGRIRILVDLGDLAPSSLCCYRDPKKDTGSILVSDYWGTGDVVRFNTDGVPNLRKNLNIKLLAWGPETGLWGVSAKSLLKLDASSLEIIASHDFDTEAEPVGLAVR